MDSGSEFHRVGAATEIAIVPIFLLTVGRKSRLELDPAHSSEQDLKCVVCSH